MNISGLSYHPNFILPEAEIALIEIIDQQFWRDDLKRRVQHYGYIYDYRARSISTEMRLGPLPDWLIPFADMLLKARIFKQRPDQIIINEYQAGQGISPHIDCLPCFGGVIASLSLDSAINMDFHNQGVSETLRLEPQSLCVLTGDARSRWKHSIANRKNDSVNGRRVARSRRISLTFRNVITGR